MLPRRWNPFASTPTQSDSATAARVTLAIAAIDNQRHERLSTMRRLMENAICLKLVRSCIAERARFEAARSSPTLAAAIAEFEAIREETPAPLLHCAAAEPDLDVDLIESEHRKLDGRARLASAALTKWTDDLAGEHERLRFRVIEMTRSLARANMLVPHSEAARCSQTPSAEAAVAAAAEVASVQSEADARLTPPSPAVDDDAATLAAKRQRISDGLERLRFAVQVSLIADAMRLPPALPAPPRTHSPSALAFGDGGERVSSANAENEPGDGIAGKETIPLRRAVVDEERRPAAGRQAAVVAVDDEHGPATPAEPAEALMAAAEERMGAAAEDGRMHFDDDDDDDEEEEEEEEDEEEDEEEEEEEEEEEGEAPQLIPQLPSMRLWHSDGAMDEARSDRGDARGAALPPRAPCRAPAAVFEAERHAEHQAEAAAMEAADLCRLEQVISARSPHDLPRSSPISPDLP